MSLYFVCAFLFYDNLILYSPLQMILNQSTPDLLLLRCLLHSYYISLI